MLEDGARLRPQSCDVFEPERLTYFFYGRSAYRPNQDENPNSLHHYLPVCLIFKPEASIAIKRVFPFDSGAFQHDFYRSYLHKDMMLGDFLLEANPESPGRIVRRFFTDNTNYSQVPLLFLRVMIRGSSRLRATRKSSTCAELTSLIAAGQPSRSKLIRPMTSPAMLRRRSFHRRWRALQPGKL